MSTGIGSIECCLSGRIHGGAPVGWEDEVGGISTYVTEPKDGSKAKTLVFIVDIFGWRIPNIRLLADESAKAGFYSYVPDFHEGDSLPMSFLDNLEPNMKKQGQLSVTDKAKNAAIVSATLGTWLPKHTEGKTKPLIHGFINTLRTTPGTNKIGAFGFGWGGRYSILEAHGPTQIAEGATIGGVDAAVACHPSLVAVPSDFDPIRVPISLAVGTKDSILDQGTVGKIQDLMAKKTNVPHELRIYADQVHGFALRGDWSSDEDRKAMDETVQQGIEWFQQYLS